MLSYKGVNVVLQRYTSIAFITGAAVCTVSDCTSVLLTPVTLRMSVSLVSYYLAVISCVVF